MPDSRGRREEAPPRPAGCLKFRLPPPIFLDVTDRAARVEALRAELESGQYRAEAVIIADAILARAYAQLRRNAGAPQLGDFPTESPDEE